MGEPPVLYLVNGEDELGISQFLNSLQEKLGDPVMAGMNTSRLDGRSASLGEETSSGREMEGRDLVSFSSELLPSGGAAPGPRSAWLARFPRMRQSGP